MNFMRTLTIEFYRWLFSKWKNNFNVPRCAFEIPLRYNATKSSIILRSNINMLFFGKRMLNFVIFGNQKELNEHM